MLIVKILSVVFFVCLVLGICFPKTKNQIEMPRNPLFLVGFFGCIVMIIVAIFYGSNLHFPGG